MINGYSYEAELKKDGITYVIRKRVLGKYSLFHFKKEMYIINFVKTYEVSNYATIIMN